MIEAEFSPTPGPSDRHGMKPSKAQSRMGIHNEIRREDKSNTHHREQRNGSDAAGMVRVRDIPAVPLCNDD